MRKYKIELLEEGVIINDFYINDYIIGHGYGDKNNVMKMTDDEITDMLKNLSIIMLNFAHNLSVLHS